MTDRPTTPVQSERAAGDAADRELIGRIAAGDRAAFRQLYEKYYHSLLRFISRTTDDTESAQEGVNDVMLVVWQRSGSFEGRSKVSTWLMGIAYRKALRLAETRGRWRARFKAGDGGDSIELFADRNEHTVDAEMADWLEHGMQSLSPNQRAVVELTYYYGYSYDEIAAVMQCPVNTVKTRMFHARAKLHRALPHLDLRETRE